jgi:hypothetical protein
MNPIRAALPALLFAGVFGTLPSASLRAQTDPETFERLRRDQDEILRKAERLQALMQRLQQRYEREKKPEQVKLLQDGLAHLDRSGILRDVALIRDDIAATALTEALRKQKDVVDDLERLLNILLERKSIENLDQEVAKIEAEARTARELEQRQRDLQQQARDAMQREPSAAEKELQQTLNQLRDAERREAESNRRQAGTRRPFLESALERVQQLLQDQKQLDQGLQDEAAGRTPDARAREFDLGELTERTRELQSELRDQARSEALGTAARDLQKAAASPEQGELQQARERFEAQVRQAPKRAAGPEGKARDPEWQKLDGELQKAGPGATDVERQELARLGQTGEKLAQQRAEEATTGNATAAESLQQAADKLAERLRGTPTTAPEAKTKTDPAAKVADAGKHLAAAKEATKAGDVAKAQQEVSAALTALDAAKREHQQQNPDADRKAAEMAAEAAATAQELQNAPSAEAAERSASEALQKAQQALRDVEKAGEQAPGGDPKAAAPERQQAAAGAKQALEQAQQTLQQALQGASADSKQEMQAAAERQQQLQDAAKQAAEQMQQAAESGQLSKPQAEKAGAKMQQAKAAMQKAQQQLQQGQQSSAADDQQAATQALQEAVEALQENRPATPQQKEQLQQQSKAQEQLAEDIVRLAEELKKRDNKNAQRKAEAAADAAKKAQRAMEQGDPEETAEQQEEARKNLEDAAKELEEEKDRYQDLRQEELLFRMKDELTAFLEKQRPITAQTQEAGKAAAADGLPRALRLKVNQLGKEEQELAGKLEFLVTALTEEGNLVYQTVLKANVEDLRETARRLTGRNPDTGPFTTLLQQDVERRTVDLLAALDRERKRREQERQDRQQQQQQGKGKNRFDPRREKLVSLIAELEMLKQLGIDTRQAADNLRRLVESRGEDVISDAEVTMIERLANRHNEITRLFQQIKASVEETLQAMQGNHEEQPPEGGRGR